MEANGRLKASDLHDAARDSLDAALSKYGFKPSGGYTEGCRSFHLYRGEDRFLIFGLDDQGEGKGEVGLGLAAADAPIIRESSILLEELARVRRLPAPRYDLGDAWEFVASAFAALEAITFAFLDGDLRMFVHDHAEILKSRPTENAPVTWPSPSLVAESPL